MQLVAGFFGHGVHDLADDLVEPRLHIANQMEGNFRHKFGGQLERFHEKEVCKVSGLFVIWITFFLSYALLALLAGWFDGLLIVLVGRAGTCAPAPIRT